MNRNDGNRTVTLTEAEYNTEMEMFASAEEVVVEEAAPADVVEGSSPEIGEVVYHGFPD